MNYNGLGACIFGFADLDVDNAVKSDRKIFLKYHEVKRELWGD